MSILSLIAEARKRGDTYQFKKDRAQTDSQSQSYTFVKVTCKTVPRQLIDYWASDCVPLNVLGSSNSIGWVHHKHRQTFLNQTFLVSNRCNLYFVVCFYLPRQNVFSKRLHGLIKVGF